jgi:hypothetical protein
MKVWAEKITPDIDGKWRTGQMETIKLNPDFTAVAVYFTAMTVIFSMIPEPRFCSLSLYKNSE